MGTMFRLSDSVFCTKEDRLVREAELDCMISAAIATNSRTLDTGPGMLRLLDVYPSRS